jgi:hypothetical protein
VFYLLLCRVLLGAVVRTRGHGPHAQLLDGGGNCFIPPRDGSENARELVAVPGSSPAVHFHSLLAESAATDGLAEHDPRSRGYSLKRHRELVVYHGNLVYPEYLLAYHRRA